MSSTITIIAILFPNPGKSSAVIEGLEKIASYAKENEPGTMAYNITQEVNKESGVPAIVIIETYKDQAAADTHLRSEALKAFGKQGEDEGLFDKPLELRFVQVIGGFASK